jgi:DNA-binding GntR family transcriptional regulator
MSMIEASQRIPENRSTDLSERIEPLEKRKPMSEEVYFMIKNAILNGDLKPGQRLIEQRLSEQMQVSRMPVREAIKKLHQYGLVARLPVRGFIVKKESHRDIEEALAIKAVLEGYAAGRACEHAGNTLIIALRKNIDASFWALKDGDLEKAAGLNTRFHQMIHKAAESDMLEKLINIYLDYVACYKKPIPLSEDAALASLEGHKTIVKAMRRGDKEKVERIARSLVYSHEPNVNMTVDKKQTRSRLRRVVCI